VLQSAREIALAEGLKYVYVGNVPGADFQNTICPQCNNTVVERRGYSILQNNVENGKCKTCAYPIAGVWNN
jgi:pyruvate formate lyase activating enzyme